MTRAEALARVAAIRGELAALHDILTTPPPVGLVYLRAAKRSADDAVAITGKHLDAVDYALGRVISLGGALAEDRRAA